MLSNKESFAKTYGIIEHVKKLVLEERLIKKFGKSRGF